jgi:hypothetical protein
MPVRKPFPKANCKPEKGSGIQEARNVKLNQESRKAGKQESRKAGKWRICSKGFGLLSDDFFSCFPDSTS